MHAQLRKYLDFVNFMGEALGSHVEVVLHDLTECENSIVAIANQEVSGRELGGPVTDLALRIMKDAEYNDMSYLCNYEGRSKSGKKLKSSTYVIRDVKGKVIGLLCINIDFSDFYSMQRLIERFIPASNSTELDIEKQIITENFNDSVEHLISNTLDQIGVNESVEITRLSQDEKIEIIKQMYHKGFFKLKGAVIEVANKMHVSEATVYRYLNIIRREERDAKKKYEISASII